MEDPAKFCFRTSTRWFWLAAVLGLALSGALVRLGLWGLRLVPVSMNEPTVRFGVGFLPLGLAASLLVGLVLLGRARGPSRWELGRRGVKMHSGSQVYLFLWKDLKIFPNRLHGLLGNALITDGRRSVRVAGFFMPEYDRFCELIVNTVNRRARSAEGTILDLDEA